jgi:hypothetical protein
MLWVIVCLAVVSSPANLRFVSAVLAVGDRRGQDGITGPILVGVGAGDIVVGEAIIGVS